LGEEERASVRFFKLIRNYSLFSCWRGGRAAADAWEDRESKKRKWNEYHLLYRLAFPSSQ